MAILHPERLGDALAAIYHASFAELKEVHTPDRLVPILAKLFGEEGTKEILIKVAIKLVRIHKSKLIWHPCSQRVTKSRSF